MDISRASMEFFSTEARVEWTNALNAVRPNLITNQIAMVVQSRTSTTKHGWLNQIPAMRKWVGDRVVNNLASNSLSISNDKFENTIEITREEFEDDEYMLYKPTFGLMGQQALQNYDRQLVDACLQGNPANASPSLWGGDGLPVFGTTRTFGSAVISNTVTTTFDSAGVALTAAISTVTAYLGHAGQPLMCRPKYLLHGPSKYYQVHQAVKTTTSAILSQNGSTYVGGVDEKNPANPNFMIVTPVQSDYLVNGYTDLNGVNYPTAGDCWFIISEVMGIKAGLVLQERIAPEMQDQRARFDTSDFVFATDKMQWGARERSKAFIGLPHMIYGAFATT